ncbi:LLM class flavin-dependent oxidoreductase [Streptomyces adonidis]|uniref:LLM class flavin-dependent oxidoreductase n=1 Tax=Streptomyces adonidis TaxID=3231367 RepID=UPI0034DAF5F2
MPQKLYGPGLLFLTREPVADLVEYARVADEEGLHSFWLAEGPHWFRNFGGEIRGALTTAAAVATATERIAIGIGIVSPYLRHPTVLAMEAGALDEISNHRLLFGLGASKAGVEYVGIDIKEQTPVATHRDAVAIMRGVFGGEKFDHEGRVFTAHVPPLTQETAKYRPDMPIFLAATGERMGQLAGELADGLLLPGLTTPGLLSFAKKNLAIGAARVNRTLPDDYPIGACLVASVAHDGAKARDRARQMATTYLANKITNIRDQTLLDAVGLTEDESAPLVAAIKRGETETLPQYVTDEMLRKTHVITGTPDEAARTLAKFLALGVNMPMFEVHGDAPDDKIETIRLLARNVVPDAVKIASGMA